MLNKVAFLILHGFDKSYRRHSRITRDAQQRFEQAKWQETQKAMKERIAIYERTLADAVGEIYQQVFPHQENNQFWLDLKIRYQKILSDHPQYELAETFYNSVIGRIFKHQQINDDMMFIMPTRCYLAGLQRHLVVHSFDTSGTVRKMLEDIFNRYHFDIAFQDIQRDLKHLDGALRARLNTAQLASVHTVEMLKSVFYRSKSAYIIGRICMPDETLPFVIPLSVTSTPPPDESNQIVVEALLTERQDLSVIFSFARSYFG